MKHLLSGALLLAGGARAQTAPAVAAPGPCQYCVLLVDDTYFSNPGRLQLDYGQQAKPAVVSPELRADEALIRKMASVVVALNYLSSRGWECWNVNTVQSKSVASGFVTSETRCLLRRRSQ